MESKDVAHLHTGLDNHLKNTPSLLDRAYIKPIDDKEIKKEIKIESLTTKNAVKFLLEGRLKKKVCRYCLNVASPLSELDQVLQIAGTGALYKISIRDMIASFYPFKVVDDPNFPNKICNKCLNRTISSYMFTQQCERSERALRNCFEDMYNKLDKLDPVNPSLKRRGKPKKHPNHNILYTEHEKVINYAEPIINIVNSGSELLIDENDIKVGDQFECLKCCQTFPNIVSLISHEKIHPKSMYYHCRHCGKSFPKRNLVKNHKKTHEPKKQKVVNTDFQCKVCGFQSVDLNEHLQHVEKHKFQTVMEHLIDRDMNKLCTVCLDKNVKLVDMDQIVCLNGGCPELMGDRSLYNILGSTVPDMNILHNYSGTKICEKCLNHAITSYVFIQQTQYVRNRLKTCISEMLDSLDKVETTEGNVFVEISHSMIMPIFDQEFDENLLLKEEEIDESKLKIEVLEDEFRQKSDSEESEPETSKSKEGKEDPKDLFSLSDILGDPENVIKDVFDFTGLSTDSDEMIDNPAKRATKTYDKGHLYNGIHQNDKKYNSLNISEFLTFKKKRKPTKRFYTCKYTCPVCNKHFVSDYFLKRHILKHINKKIGCSMCDNVFKSKFYLYEHIKMCHILKQTEFTPCKVCGRTFVSLKKLDIHLQSHLKKECLLCNKVFLSQKYYDSHMERHVAKLRLLKQRRTQNCSFCEKECSNDNELSVHVNKVHLQIKPYSCDMCERQFYTESNLCSHKKVHNLFSKESCQFCGKNLKCRRDLVVHLRKHIGVQPHVCPICSKTFYSNGIMMRHMTASHGGAYCCKLCKCILKTKSGLKYHIIGAHNII